MYIEHFFSMEYLNVFRFESNLLKIPILFFLILFCFIKSVIILFNDYLIVIYPSCKALSLLPQKSDILRKL
jgi:hypothetical protein